MPASDMLLTLHPAFPRGKFFSLSHCNSTLPKNYACIGSGRRLSQVADFAKFNGSTRSFTWLTEINTCAGGPCRMFVTAASGRIEGEGPDLQQQRKPRQRQASGQAAEPSAPIVVQSNEVASALPQVTHAATNSSVFLHMHTAIQWWW